MNISGRSNKTLRSAGITALSFTVFLLMALPRAGVRIGPVPLYLIDIALLLSYYFSVKAADTLKSRPPFYSVVITILAIAVVSELVTALFQGNMVQPIYTIARTLLAFSIFFSASRLIQSEEDLLRVVKAAAIGLLITSLLMILSSLKSTAGLVIPIFSISYLNPAFESQAAKMILWSQYGISMRGTSLVGVSILSAAFMLAMWPFLIMYARLRLLKRSWQILFFLNSLLIPFAVVFSYSRGAILGLIFVVCGMIYFGSSKTRSWVIIASLGLILTINMLGWNSEHFKFWRIQERVEAMVENPFAEEEESERILSYIEPFAHVLDKPWFLIFGEGNTIGRLTRVSEAAGAANHSVFGHAYYAYGMVAAFIYLILIYRSFRYLQSLSTIHHFKGGVGQLTAQTCFASLLGILPWIAFGHAAVSTPRGATLFFFIIGLIGVSRNITMSELRQGERLDVVT